jgi:hypothetical protein
MRFQQRARQLELSEVPKMNKRYFSTRLLRSIGVVLSILIASIGFAIAQGPGQPPGPPRPFDHLAGLRHALEDAGAPALSTEQESTLIAIGKSFRDSLPKPGPAGTGRPDESGTPGL